MVHSSNHLCYDESYLSSDYRVLPSLPSPSQTFMRYQESGYIHPLSDRRQSTQSVISVAITSAFSTVDQSNSGEIYASVKDVASETSQKFIVQGQSQSHSSLDDYAIYHARPASCTGYVDDNRVNFIINP